MANPTILAENFSASLGAFSGTGAVRLYGGLWLEQGTTNLLPNPNFATDTAGWALTNNASRSVARTASLPAVLPNELASLVTTGLESLALQQMTGTYPGTMGSNNITFSGAIPHMLSGYLYMPAAWTGGPPRITMVSLTSASGELEQAADLALRDQWQRVECGPFTPDAGDLVGSAGVSIAFPGTWNDGQEFWSTGFQVEAGSVVTSLAASTFGAGYSGTTSQIRAASSASVTIAEPASVACWYREGYSGAKAFAYIEPYGALGTYGSIAWSGGTLTLSTSRNLVIGPFAAFSRALTATEQANLRSTQNWSMNSVNGSNIILPLSGRRRRR